MTKPDESTSDDVLLDKLKGGDSGAYTLLYNRYWDALYGKAFQRLQDESSSKDVVQNVFIDLWRRRENLEIKNLRSYLYGAVRFQVFKQIDRSNKHHGFFEPFEHMMISPIRTDGEIIRDDLAKLLTLWIEALPEKRRAIFVLHYSQQLSVSEIASHLNITQKTVYNQLNNSVKELKWKLTKLVSFSSLIYVLIELSLFG